MFGTCGIRKKFSTYDKSEQTFTPNMALRLGEALGTAIDSGTVVIGRDIRTAAVAIEYAIISGLVSTGCKVFTIGMVTTPTLAVSIDFLNADCGVMITASHNPPEYIGVKLWNKQGLGYSPEQEQRIEEIYQNREFVRKSWNELGSVTQVHDINAVHVNKILKNITFPVRHKPYNVIVDPGNGSASEIGPKLLSQMGINFISLNSQPDGTFPGRQSEPSSKNLQDLRAFVAYSEKIDLGIAFDGDADRVVFVDENGVPIEPIRVLTFLAKEFIDERYPDAHTRPKLAVVTPVNSSGVIEHILEPMGVKVYRTKVGDINVSQAMKQYDAFLGGENCGVYIWPEFTKHMAPDSLAAIAILYKYMSKYDCKISELLNDIPIFPYIKGECHLVTDQNFSLDDYQIIAKKMIAELESAGYQGFQITTIDGLHILFDKGWILIRKSGTTPIMRLTVESKSDLDEANQLYALGRKIIASFVDILSDE